MNVRKKKGKNKEEELIFTDVLISTLISYQLSTSHLRWKGLRSVVSWMKCCQLSSSCCTLSSNDKCIIKFF